MVGLDTLPTCVMSILINKLTRSEQGAFRLVSKACQQQTRVLSAAKLCTMDFKQLSKSLSQLPALKEVCIHANWPEMGNYTAYTAYTQVILEAPLMVEAMSALTSLTALTFDVAAAMHLGTLKWAHIEADRAVQQPEASSGTADDGDQPSINNTYCEFYWVPDCLAAAPNLQRLAFEDPFERVKVVPYETSSWMWLNHNVWASKLTSLHVANMNVLCDIKSLTLQHLTRLEHLQISGGRLPPADAQHVVQQLGSCTQLTGLQLSGNNMWLLPALGWEGLTGLKLLEVSSCQVSSLPSGLSCLTALTALHVDHMGLQELPLQLSNIGNLVHVRASHNWLSGAGSTLPGLLDGWPKLAVLELDNVSDKNGMLVLPSKLAACRHLKELSIKDNYSIDWKSLKAVLPKCKGLEVLRLTNDDVNTEQLQDLRDVLPASCTVVSDGAMQSQSPASSGHDLSLDWDSVLEYSDEWA